MNNIYKNIEKYNPNKERKILVQFYAMIADMLINRKFNPEVTKLFNRRKKQKVFSCFYYTVLFCYTKKY